MLVVHFPVGKAIDSGLVRTGHMLWLFDPSIVCDCRLWYLERDGGKAASTLVSVDSSVAPPSYAVRIDKTNSVRYATNVPRLGLKPALVFLQLSFYT